MDNKYCTVNNAQPIRTRERRIFIDMFLFSFTILYCVITQVLNIGYLLAMGVYLIGLSLIKGLFSEELKDVFNFKRTKYLYEKNGFKASLMELLSLMLIFINSILIDYEPLSLFEYVYLLFLIALVYRFLFWGITGQTGKI